jgi:hypothetical protein
MRTRWIGALSVALVVVAVAACGGDDGDDAPGACTYMGQTYPVDAIWPAGDGCNTCHCSAEIGVECTIVACVDAEPVVPCAPSGACTGGQPCGPICCGAGERCNYGVCECGDGGDACGAGDSCEPFGPAACGSICCGVSGPCPQ